MKSFAFYKCLGIKKFNYILKKCNLLLGVISNLHRRGHTGNKDLEKCIPQQHINSVHPPSINVPYQPCPTDGQMQIKIQILPLNVHMELLLCSS